MERRPPREVVTEEFRQLIIDGEFPPRSRLGEGLAQRPGVCPDPNRGHEGSTAGDIVRTAEQQRAVHLAIAAATRPFLGS